MLNHRKTLLFTSLFIGLIGLWIYLAGFTRHDLRRFLHQIGLRANGHIHNRSSQSVWVIVSGQNRSWAYRLGPNHKSPDSLDADAVKSVNGVPIRADTTWYKVLDGGKAELTDTSSGLYIDCVLCYPDHDREFDHIIYTDSPKWGTPL